MRLRIGDVLLEAGFINEEQLAQSLEYQKTNEGVRLGEAVVELGFATEEQVLLVLGQRLSYPVIRMTDIEVDLQAVKKVPRQLAMKYKILAYGQDEGMLHIAVNDPLDFYGLEDIRQFTGMELKVVLVTMAPLIKALEYYYSEVAAIKAADQINVTNAIDVEMTELDELLEIESSSDVPVIKLLNSLVIRAYTNGASDIHIEPYENETVVRMRMDGVIMEYIRLNKSIHMPLMARVKIMGEMDIAERRLPQDGHFIMTVQDSTQGFKLNMRVSIIPTVYGEKAVLRLLNQQRSIDHVHSYGMTDENYKKIKQILKSPNGILYLAGPTGSGKTTTLYMILQDLAKMPVNISTIEDPVEKNIEKVMQMQVNNRSGLTFESGLRALLRQDPDIIMVGETRDSETAEISTRAAITGHLVLSTLHTNSAVSTIVRLKDMGLENYLIANSLVGVVAQRLVRKVCGECRVARKVTERESVQLGSDITRVAQAVGCSKCNHTGYSGRVSVHEIMVVDDHIQRLIATNATMEEIQAYAQNHLNMRTLSQEARQLVKEGITTMEEYNKLTYNVEG